MTKEEVIKKLHEIKDGLVGECNYLHREIIKQGMKASVFSIITIPGLDEQDPDCHVACGGDMETTINAVALYLSHFDKVFGAMVLERVQEWFVKDDDTMLHRRDWKIPEKGKMKIRADSYPREWRVKEIKNKKGE